MSPNCSSSALSLAKALIALALLAAAAAPGRASAQPNASIHVDAPVAELPAVQPESAPALTREAWEARKSQLHMRIDAVLEEKRTLLRANRSEHSVVPGLVIMGAGFGLSAAALGVGFLSSMSHSSEGSDEKTQRSLLWMHAVGIPVGLSGVGLTLYEIRQRPNRSRTRELDAEYDALRREIREIRRTEKLQRRDGQEDSWSLAPRLSVTERRAGLTLKLAF